MRSDCALYRTELIRQHANGFFDESEVAGKALHRKLEEAEFQLIFLESDHLSRYINHLNHTTLILNPDKQEKKTSKPSELKRIQNQLKKLGPEELLATQDLDRL